MLNAVTSFEFIISLIGFYGFLHPLTVINNRLQGRVVDIIEAYDKLSMIFEQPERVATKVGAEPSMLPVTSCKCERTFSFYHGVHIYCKCAGKIFLRLHSQMLNVSSLIFEEE